MGYAIDRINDLLEENNNLQKRICELQTDLSRAKSQIEKMKRCGNCKYLIHKHEYFYCNFENKESFLCSELTTNTKISQLSGCKNWKNA